MKVRILGRGVAVSAVKTFTPHLGSCKIFGVNSQSIMGTGSRVEGDYESN